MKRNAIDTQRCCLHQLSPDDVEPGGFLRRVLRAARCCRPDSCSATRARRASASAASSAARSASLTAGSTAAAARRDRLLASLSRMRAGRPRSCSSHRARHHGRCCAPPGGSHDASAVPLQPRKLRSNVSHRPSAAPRTRAGCPGSATAHPARSKRPGGACAARTRERQRGLDSHASPQRLRVARVPER